jgi:putative ABC transport system permease protein
MRAFVQDFRSGWRMLLHNPRLTIVAVLTLALGIAASTTVFSWIDSLLLHPYPGVEKAGELMAIETTTANGEHVENSYLDYRDYRDHLKTLSGLTMFVPLAMNMGEADRTEKVWGMMVTGNYFDVLGVKPETGRLPSLRRPRPPSPPRLQA